jgi:hypothetical protein
VSYENNAVEELWRYTRGHPWLLQSLCFLLIEDMNRRGDGNYIAVGHVTNAIQRFISQHNLDSLWERCTLLDKAILIALAQPNENVHAGMAQVELVGALDKYSEEEISSSLHRLIKRTLLEESLSASGELRYCHTILLFARWLAVHTGSLETERL